MQPTDSSRFYPLHWPRWAQYGFALSLAAGALLARWSMTPLLGDRAPFILVFAALLLLVGLVRPGPFLAAAVLGGLGSLYFFVAPESTWRAEGPAGPTTIVLFALAAAAAGLTAWLSGRAQDRLIEARQRAEVRGEELRVTLASIGDAVVTTDERGNVTFLNDVAQELTGWSRDGARGRPLAAVFNIINEQTREPVESPVDRVLQTGQVVSLANHTVLIRKDGTELAIDDSASPIRDRDGRLTGVILVFHDISERRAAEGALVRSERELSDFFENASVGLHWVGPDGIILRANQAELDLLGYRKDEYVGRHIAEFHVDQPVIDSILACLSRGEALQKVPARLRCKDGSMRDVLISSSVYFEDGKFVHTRCFTLDVTDRRKSEIALLQSERKLRAIYDGTHEYIGLLSVDGTLLDANRALLEFAGSRREDVVGQPFSDMVWFQYTAGAPELVRQAIGRAARGEFVRFEAPIVDPSGATRQFDISFYPIQNEDGEVTLIVPEGREITELRRADRALIESEARYRAVGEAIDFGIWVCDAEGRNTYVSESFLRLTGLTQEQCSNFGWRDVLHPDEAEKTIADWQHCVQTNGTWDREHRIRGVDGKWHALLARGVPIKDNNGPILGWAGINLDISRLKTVEEALLVADRRKDVFLAILAHELRNPLAPISNALEIVKHTTRESDTVGPLLGMIERQLGQLVRLVDDLLEVGRISQGKLTLKKERIDVPSIVQQALESCRPALEAAQHRLSVVLPQEPIELFGDPLRLAQIVSNLLGNSCKYTEPGGEIQVTAALEGSVAVISIKDNGVGIPEQMLSRIFDMFHQIDQSRHRAQGGLGIGLSLVRSLVEMHGGTVVAKSDGPGRGSEFIVRLPVVVDADRRQSTTPATSPPDFHRPRRILVVDDNEDAATSLSMLMKLNGHATHVEYDGLSALKAAAEFQPDVVLLDIGLPGLDGYEAARRLRQQPWGKRLLLIALTGWGEEGDRRKSGDAGFNCHLVKPVDHASLARLLADWPA